MSAELPRSVQDAASQSRRDFVAAVSTLRPRLHRFCAGMCGSALDGEDVVQEALADAFYNLVSLNDPARFEAWLFRIAFFRCVDFLRKEGGRRYDVSYDDEHDQFSDADAALEGAPVDHALLTLVGALPPKERAAVVLKDVLDHSLEEIASIADTTLGGAKAALHRGRAKLRSATAPLPVAALGADRRLLFEAYADCFNRQDWEGLGRLVRADARLEIVGEKVGVMSGLGVRYRGNYASTSWKWRISVATVDGIPVLLHSKLTDSGAWQPHTVIRLWWEGDKVVRIRDYIHVSYLLDQAVVQAQ